MFAISNYFNNPRYFSHLFIQIIKENKNDEISNDIRIILDSLTNLYIIIFIKFL